MINVDVSVKNNICGTDYIWNCKYLANVIDD